MKLRTLFVAVLVALSGTSVQAQYLPWAVQWLNHAYSPLAGRQYLGVTNLLAGTNVLLSSIGNGDFKININVPWGCLSGFGVTMATLPAINTYTHITNFLYAATNRFDVGMTNGYLTNTVAGWYRINFAASVLGANNDELEIDLATNDITTDLIAAHCSMAAPAKDESMSGVGILYLPTNTTVSLYIKNVDSTTLTISHCQLTVGTP